MLYVVATPIGNLEDISKHAISVLRSVDFILCEDTRRTGFLLSELQIPAPQLISCHAHNEQGRIQRAMEELAKGKHAALLSDAGTPAISDPGMFVVQAAHQAHIPVIPISGPSAVSVAISASGFVTPPYHFLGFPPRKHQKRRDWIVQLSQLDGVVVLFEAGNRFGDLIADLRELLPDREACLCRELTKTYQEILRQPILDFTPENVLGEVTLVIGPGSAVMLEKERQAGIKGLAQSLADEWQISKREAYNLLMQIKPRD